MKTKLIKLSSKKSGKGYVSSYTVNLGLTEVSDCGFLKEDGEPKRILKSIDPISKQIILRPKEITFTREIIGEIIRLATILNGDFERAPMQAVNIAEFLSQNNYAFQRNPHEENLIQYLTSLGSETLYDVETLMYLGRDRDYDEDDSYYDRFINCWEGLLTSGAFRSLEEDAEHIAEKAPLARYLSDGLRIIGWE